MEYLFRIGLLPILLIILQNVNLSAQEVVPRSAAVASGEVVQLQPFAVIADTDAGYRPTHTSALTRTNREIITLPQSVEILTAEFLFDTGARMMDEAFVYVGNAQVRNSSAEPDANVTLIRGFTNSTSYTDGIDTGTYRRDLFGYERMEVIKGPASAVQGRGTDSGYINFVLKKPLIGANFNRFGASYSIGENNKTGQRFTFDRNFTISNGKGLYGRVAAVWDHHDHYFDFARFKTAGLYPSIRWVLNDKTEVIAVGEFLDVQAPNRSPGHGFAWIPAKYRKVIPTIGASNDPITALNLPTNFNIGGPQTGAEDTVASILAIATHKFSDAVQYRQAISGFRSTQDGEWWDAESNFPTPAANISAAFKADPATKYDPNGIYIPVQHGFQIRETDRLNIQGDLNMEYGYDWVEFVSLVGYAYKDQSNYLQDNSSTIPTRYSFINLRDPQNAWEGRTITPGSIRVSRSQDTYYKEFGYYLQQDINLLDSRLLMSGGYRRDTATTSTLNRLTGTESAKVKTTVNSWRMASTYRVTDGLSVYGILSEQNNPSIISSSWLSLPAGDPRLNETFVRTPATELVEFGFKGYLFERRVTYTASYFEITASGQLNNDRVDTTSQAPDSFGQPVLSALRQFASNGDTANGIELALFGQITQRWDLNVSYATLNTEQPITGGSRPIRHNPEWNTSLFSRYNFRDSAGKGFGLRGGVSAIGPFIQQVGGALARIRIDRSQWRADLGVDYHFSRQQSVDLLVKNVTNSPYIVTRTNPPREIVVSYRYAF